MQFSELQPALDYFIAGVPPLPLLELSIDDLEELVRAKENKENVGTTCEICLIGLTSYFEAFCKNLFAGIVNICPQLLENFNKIRPDISISVEHILAYSNNIGDKLGSILSEKYDFGSGKKINSLFFDLINKTFFSVNEKKEYDRLLNDRNLLVHHGGIYTLKYKGQKFRQKEVRERIFLDSLIVRPNNFLKWLEFIKDMAKKMNGIAVQVLEDFIKKEEIELDKERKKALKLLDYQFDTGTD